MEIIVEGRTIDTREIWKIESAQRGYHGFVIGLIDKSDFEIRQKKDLTGGKEQENQIENKYDKLRKAVEAKWNEDKNDIPTFKL